MILGAIKHTKIQQGCCYSCAVLHDHADALGQFVMDIRGAAKVTRKTLEEVSTSLSQALLRQHFQTLCADVEEK